MGKNARNERLKLRATFYNNMAVGLVLTAILIPYFSFVRVVPDFVYWLKDYHDGAAAFSGLEFWKAVYAMATFVMAVFGAIAFRDIANRSVARLED